MPRLPHKRPRISREVLIAEYGEELADEYLRVHQEAAAVTRRANQLKRKADDGTITKAEQREYNRILAKGFDGASIKLFELMQKLK